MAPAFIESKTFHPDIRDLGVTHEIVAEGLGYPPGLIPSRIRRAMDRTFYEAAGNLSPRCGFAIISPESFTLNDDHVACSGVALAVGDVIAPFLRNAKTVAVFIATAGIGADRWISSLFASGDALKAVIADSIGSSVAELSAAWLEKTLGKSSVERGWNVSNRYSPGYCGWPTGDQKALFSLLPENFCDVRLTDASMMIPLKSVSGVIGLGPSMQRLGYRCAICDLEDCFRRREETAAI